MTQRILLLGYAPQTLEALRDELAELGIAASAMASTSPCDGTEFELGLYAPDTSPAERHRARERLDARTALIEAPAPLAVSRAVSALDGAPAPSIDLDAYCTRIGYRGPREASFRTLAALQEHHPAAIAFENLDVLLGKTIDLTPEHLDAKLIDGRRGGYCFEHNKLFKRALEALGFKVDGLIARVLWQAPAGSAPGLPTHMALRVWLDGTPWLVDVGFGGNMPTTPLDMTSSAPQPTPHGLYRVMPFGDGWRLQVRIDDRWHALYELSPTPQLDIDYELPNWYTATYPESHFRHHLTVALSTPEARYSLADRRLTVRTIEGQQTRTLLDADGLERALREAFGLAVSPDWRPLLERLAET
ncbi:arylamine N-acetyltransferase family protein [Halomonas caseinilytica]|uniref:arylamine N-acetyltransferase family protein n=1 Tax=Halomonas caseinilytica TaxID=438744 RepID=UPI0008BFE6E3|nr:arylamine N-acetyltransferase [Halomonas caseinilytica]SEN25734.1 N-hydroxyarylamine O-acetyltransferase [Halomonas caseinilytica]